MPEKSRSVGAALAVIIPTIITDHMMKVKKKSRALQSASIAIPIFAIDSAPGDISLSMRKR